MAALIRFVKDIKRRWDSLEGSLFPYALAASFMMTLAPITSAMVLFFAEDEHWISVFVQIFSRFFPETLILQAVDYIRFSPQYPQPLFVSLAVAVWIASKSPAHFLMLSKREHQSQIPHLVLRIMSVGITLQLGILFLITASLVRFLKLSGWIATELMLLGGLYVFYRSVSLKRFSWKDEVPGSLIAFVLINGIGMFFFFYINHIASTDALYGPLSSLVIVFLSCFAVSNVIFLGYSSNEALRNEKCCVFHYPKAEKLGERIWKCE